MEQLQFIKDLRMLNLGKVREKYWDEPRDAKLINLSDRKVKDKIIYKLKGITIKGLVDTLKNSELGLEFLINSGYENQSDLTKPFYLNYVDGKFEVFELSDRGGKALLQYYGNIDEAAFDWFDMYLNELMYAAPDSIINAETKAKKVPKLQKFAHFKATTLKKFKDVLGRLFFRR
jgi:hypothetical protein